MHAEGEVDIRLKLYGRAITSDLIRPKMTPAKPLGAVTRLSTSLAPPTNVIKAMMVVPMSEMTSVIRVEIAYAPALRWMSDLRSSTQIFTSVSHHVFRCNE